ncbi:MAG TPA: hypothetical protein VD706_00650 [Candidatus Saccharimonadales bacterium]|nr:hypothetical protein [Candidatus Saccharimonadales bacterium]
MSFENGNDRRVGVEATRGYRRAMSGVARRAMERSDTPLDGGWGADTDMLTPGEEAAANTAAQEILSRTQAIAQARGKVLAAHDGQHVSGVHTETIDTVPYSGDEPLVTVVDKKIPREGPTGYGGMVFDR